MNLKLNFKLFNKERDKKILKWFAIGVIIAAALVTVKDEFLYQVGYYDSENPAVEESESLPCNVAVIKLHGDLYVDAIAEDGEISSTEIIDLLLYAFRSPPCLKYLPWENESQKEFEERSKFFGLK